MTTGPEAKAAEAGLNRRCDGCAHEEELGYCRLKCLTEEMFNANAAHYLPLLRDLRKATCTMSGGRFAAIDAEIKRLEEGNA
jgi:hypothetical protein